jgi:16S rRNA (guanine527-N7)-methyltransferase
MDSELESKLRRLVEVFLAENAKLNLSALRTPEQCWMGNVMDSLPLIDLLPKLNTNNEHLRILDIGTGGGFPLFPLAIALPQTELIGMDATRKKIDAVGRIAEAMELTNALLITGRAEELGHDPDLRESFDIVTARAVAPINTLLEYASPFTQPLGHIVLWKSLHAEEELHESLLARAELSCHLIMQHEYDLGGDWGTRQLLIFQKTATLSRKYPRGVGIPKKDPLR